MVVNAVPLHWTVEPLRKPDPFRANVKAAPSAWTEAGLMLVSNATLPAMLKFTELLMV